MVIHAHVKATFCCSYKCICIYCVSIGFPKRPGVWYEVFTAVTRLDLHCGDATALRECVLCSSSCPIPILHGSPNNES